jgi:precorrin-2 dehydrogenase/sirohydrochlorin ferrochelatase
MAESNKFPKVEGGGSLILAWQIKNKHVLVVGGGEVRFETFSPLLSPS